MHISPSLSKDKILPFSSCIDISVEGIGKPIVSLNVSPSTGSIDAAGAVSDKP